MPDDLTARLERALRVQEEHETTAGADPAALSELAGRVARARRRRTARYAAVAAVTVVVVGAAGMFGLRDRAAPLPADTPTPVPTSTRTPAASVTAAPEPSPAPSALQLEPVSRPGMPPMYRAPEGLLEQTGPGWYLVTYASALYEPVPGDGERAAVAVAAPTGELYHLLDRETRGLTIVRWPLADVARVMVESPLRAGSLDLRTGEVTIDDRLPTGVMWVGAAGADEVWQAQDGSLLVLPPDGPAREIDARLLGGQIAPDGLTIVGDDDGTTVAVDLRTGERTELVRPEGQRCDVVGWFDGTGVLAACVDPQPLDQAHLQWFHDEHGGQVARLDAAGGPPVTLEVLDSAGVVPYRGTYVRDGVVAAIEAPLVSGSGDCFDFCYGGAHQWFEDGARVAAPLPPGTTDTVCRVQAGTGGLLVWTGDPCYEQAKGGQWWAVDETTGTVRLVAPAVDSDLTIGAGWDIVERAIG